MHHLIEHFTAARAVDYKELKISSTAFNNIGLIPTTYTCYGKNINPPLNISHIPKSAKSLAIIVIANDAPIRPWVHWVVWNIPITHHIKEDKVTGIEGINDFQTYQYGGPCSTVGIHHYHFKVYALSEILDLPKHTNKHQLEKAMSNCIIGFGELIGTY